MHTLRQAARSRLLAALLMAAAGAAFGPLVAPTQFPMAFAQTVTVVNAASYDGAALAANTIAAAYGAFKTQNDQPFTAAAQPLPTALGGISVTINGTPAPLFYASNNQINLLIPSSTAPGAATVIVTSADGSTRTGNFTVVAAAPGLFSANAEGRGTAAAQTTYDGVTYQQVANPDGSGRPIDPGTASRPNFLVLYATGLRNTPAANPNDGNGVAEAVTVTIQGVLARVEYAGPSICCTGLDQLNVVIPLTLADFGTAQIRVTANGRTSNAVTVNIGGEPPAISTQPITPGQTISGELTTSDQVLPPATASSGASFYFDAYRFSAAAGTTLAIDMRSSQVDAFIQLYRVRTDPPNEGVLAFVAEDDQTGGLATGQPSNNNALLLTVLPETADYVILVTTAEENPNGVGAYTLKLVTDVIQPISYGQSTSGARIATTDLQTSVGYYLDAYYFTGAQGDRVEINMISAEFDPFLFLYHARGVDRFIAQDDNGGGGVNARITRTLPEAGPYIIVATPFQANVTGNYTLSLTRTGAGFAAEGADIDEAARSARPVVSGRAPSAERRRPAAASERQLRGRSVTREQ